MSKYIDEIVSDIRTNPDTWKRTRSTALSKGDIEIRYFGNGSKWFFYWGTSIVSVYINGIPDGIDVLTIRDKANLEEAFIWWNQNVSLKTISNK